MAKMINVPLTVTELSDLVHLYERWASSNEKDAVAARPKFKKLMLEHAGRYQNRATELRRFLPK